MTELFKDGDHLSIVTDAKDEGEFLLEVCEALDVLIGKGTFEGDWDFQLGFWLPEIVDICCAYRGYKSTVAKRVMYIAGDPYPRHGDLVIRLTSRVEGDTERVVLNRRSLAEIISANEQHEEKSAVTT